MTRTGADRRPGPGMLSRERRTRCLPRRRTALIGCAAGAIGRRALDITRTRRPARPCLPSSELAAPPGRGLFSCAYNRGIGRLCQCAIRKPKARNRAPIAAARGGKGRFDPAATRRRAPGSFGGRKGKGAEATPRIDRFDGARRRPCFHHRATGSQPNSHDEIGPRPRSERARLRAGRQRKVRAACSGGG
jgi:hypothetical protein